MGIFRIARPTYVSLSENDLSIRRDIVREERYLDETYVEKYDNDTLFYDVVRADGFIYLIGPPLLNLEAAIEGVECNGMPVKLEKARISRSNIWRFSHEADGEANVEIGIRDAGAAGARKIKLVVEEDPWREFEGAKILFTLQKDNDLVWIHDWVKYYVTVHNIDSVVIYDNGSSVYTLEEILGAVRTAGVANAVVVNWDFKYGPQGAPWTGPNVPWDSDFCQIGALNSVRFRYAFGAHFINADIDELVVPLHEDEDQSIFSYMDKRGMDRLHYHGYWIESACPADVLEKKSIPQFADYVYRREDAGFCGYKWTGKPRNWPYDHFPTAHYFGKSKDPFTSDFVIAHFKPINNSWKIPSRSEIRLIGESEVAMPELRSVLKSVFPVSGDAPKNEAAEARSVGRAIYKLHAARKEYENGVKGVAGDVAFARAMREKLQADVLARLEDRWEWDKCWIWRERWLVFDFTQGQGKKFAFDFLVEPALVRLVLVARDIRDAEFVHQIASAIGIQDLRTTPNRHGVVCFEEPLDKLTLDEVVLIASQFMHMARAEMSEYFAK